MVKKKNKKIKRSKVISNIIFNIIALISTVLALVFCVYLYKLDMLPMKYLRIVFIGIGVFYLILLALTLPRKLKIGFKIVACLFFVAFGFAFGYGIKFSDKTIGALDKINDDLKQKEEYQIKAIAKNNITKENMNGKKVGLFKNANHDNIMKVINKGNYNFTITDYDDPLKLFDDLDDNKIDLVIASDTVYELLETDLSYMKLELSNVSTLEVPIDEKIKDVVKIVDVTNTPFNIYIAGGDKYGSIDKTMNTDVNMVVSVDVKNHKLLLTSIPRDYYVILPSKGEDAYDKLTHAGYYGVGESIKAVEKLLDIDINYYAKINFTTVEKIVDAIGGIDVYVDKPFHIWDKIDYNYPKGINHMNGRNALRYARERYSFSDGDVQRVKNQQKVIDAIIKKMTSSSTLLSSYTDILESVSKNFSTSLDRKSISRIVKAQLSDMRGWTSESQNLVGFSATSKNCFSLKGWDLYVMKQDPKSVKANSDKIKEFLGLNVSSEETNEKTENKEA